MATRFHRGKGWVQELVRCYGAINNYFRFYFMIDMGKKLNIGPPTGMCFNKLVFYHRLSCFLFFFSFPFGLLVGIQAQRSWISIDQGLTLCKKACPYFLSYTNLNKMNSLHHINVFPKISNVLQFESHSCKYVQAGDPIHKGVSLFLSYTNMNKGISLHHMKEHPKISTSCNLKVIEVKLPKLQLFQI